MADESEEKTEQAEQVESEKADTTATAEEAKTDTASALEKIAGKMLTGKSRDTETGRFTAKKGSKGDANSTSDDTQPAEQDDSPAKVEAKETTKPDTPVFSKRAIATAKQFGLDPEKLADMTSEEILEAGGVGYNRKMSEVGHWQQELKQLRTAAKASTAKAEPTETDNADKTTFAEDDFDVSGEGGIVAKLNSTIERLEIRLDELETGNQIREDAEIADKADLFFDGLDKKVFPEFGAGKTMNFDEVSSEFIARNKVISGAITLQKAHEMDGEHISFEQALDWTVQIKFADNVKAAEKQKLATKVKDRRAQGGNPPTSRKGKATEATTREQKISNIREAGVRGGLAWG